MMSSYGNIMKARGITVARGVMAAHGTTMARGVPDSGCPDTNS